MGDSKLYVCDLCGKPTSNHTFYWSGPICGKDGYSWCDECISDFERKQEWENEQSGKENITCPWCGYEDTDSWEFDAEYDDDYERLEAAEP